MQRGYDFGSVCLFMDLLAIELQNLWTDFDEILRKCRKWDEK